MSEDNIIFYPPQARGPDEVESSLEVCAGDDLNITWSTTYESVDLSIEAYAANSNFTVTPFYNAQLPGTEFFLYTLQPRDYYINDTSLPIEAFFRISNHDQPRDYIRTQNFTIRQPVDVPLDFDGIPRNAQTHTGSVTLYSSLGTMQVMSVSTDSTSSTAITITATEVTATGNPVTSNFPMESGGGNLEVQDDRLSAGARAGLGIGVTVALLLFIGLVGAAILLFRRKRQRRAAGQNIIDEGYVFGGQRMAGDPGWRFWKARTVNALPVEVGSTPEYYGGNEKAGKIGEVDSIPVHEADQGIHGPPRTPVELDGVAGRRHW